jgi:hypothetical protein
MTKKFCDTCGKDITHSDNTAWFSWQEVDKGFCSTCLQKVLNFILKLQYDKRVELLENK